MDQTLTVSADDVMRVLATPTAPTLIDVCIPEDIAADPWRLPGARHVPHRDIQDWAAHRSAVGSVIVICQKGLKLSHGAAALLRASGIDARALDGGNQGWAARGLPRIAINAHPKQDAPWVLPAATGAAWVAAWIIHRWFDPTATIMWVPAAMCAQVAERFEVNAPTCASLIEFCRDIGLDYPPLSAFLAHIDQETAYWLPLLQTPQRHHKTPDDAYATARHIVDAAWAAHLSEVA